MLPFLGQRVTIRPLLLLQINFFPYQHPKVWWPINDMHINSIKNILKNKNILKKKKIIVKKNVCVSSIL